MKLGAQSIRLSKERSTRSGGCRSKQPWLQQAARRAPLKIRNCCPMPSSATEAGRQQQRAGRPNLGPDTAAGIQGGCQARLQTMETAQQQRQAGRRPPPARKPSPQTPAPLRASPAAQPPCPHLRRIPQSSLRVSPPSASHCLARRRAAALPLVTRPVHERSRSNGLPGTQTP